jgi:hypothetical protein
MVVLSFKLCRVDLVVKSATLTSHCRICLRQGALLKSQLRRVSRETSMAPRVTMDEVEPLSAAA